MGRETIDAKKRRITTAIYNEAFETNRYNMPINAAGWLLEVPAWKNVLVAQEVAHRVLYYVMFRFPNLYQPIKLARIVLSPEKQRIANEIILGILEAQFDERFKDQERT